MLASLSSGLNNATRGTLPPRITGTAGATCSSASLAYASVGELQRWQEQKRHDVRLDKDELSDPC
jgi:hypothetical protein